jgi:hypothetical protein
MKKQIVCPAILLSVLLFGFVAQKTFTIKLTESQMLHHWQNLEMIKQVADQSQLPHNQVKFIISSIDSLQRDFQVNLKVDSVKTK